VTGSLVVTPYSIPRISRVSSSATTAPIASPAAVCLSPSRALFVHFGPEEREHRVAPMEAGRRRDREVGEQRETLRLGKGEPKLVPLLIAKIDGAESAKVNHAATGTRAVTGGRGVVRRSLRATVEGLRAHIIV